MVSALSMIECREGRSVRPGGRTLRPSRHSIMLNALTIDVEDYHSIVSRDWCGEDMLPTRKVVDNTRRLLDRFAERGVLGTFFILGEVAQTYPDLIRQIAAPGHELGVHGFYHRQVFKLDAASFHKEVADAKAIIEDISGQKVHG